MLNATTKKMKMKMKMNMVVKVKKQTVKARMKCPLCHKLFKEATTISLCLHTFCRKCIYHKLSDQEMDCCPVCNIDLGYLPLEKLRPDHSLQDIRAKIFPFKRRKVEVQQVVPSISPLAKRNEKSLSSLVVSAPKVSTNASFTGKRTKTGANKAAAFDVATQPPLLTPGVEHVPNVIVLGDETRVASIGNVGESSTDFVGKTEEVRSFWDSRLDLDRYVASILTPQDEKVLPTLGMESLTAMIMAHGARVAEMGLIMKREWDSVSERMRGLEKLEQRKAELEGQCGGLNDELELLRTEKTFLSTQLEEMKTKLNGKSGGLDDELELLRTEKAFLSTQLEEMKTKMTTEKEEMAAELVVVKARRDEVVADLGVVSLRIGELTAELAKVTKRLACNSTCHSGY